ncbi:MAG: response regulator transcription factor [Geminicoccaceae bacterium]
MRILLLEDAPDVAEAIVARFRQRGDAIDHVSTLADARHYLAIQDYDVAILDIGLPDGEGTEILRTLRAGKAATPVLMLTARGRIDERVAALDGGADDYLVKPSDLRELEARVRALHRRQTDERSTVVHMGRLTFDSAGCVVHIAGQPVQLTRREFSLLETMVRNRGRVVPKETIFGHMFAFDDEPASLNAVEIQVARLRRKLQGSGLELKTLRGLGYQLVTID